MMKPPKEKQKEIAPLDENIAIALLEKDEVPSFAKYKGVANTMMEHNMFKKAEGKSLQWQIDDLSMKLEYCRSMGYPDQFANNVYPADGKFEEDFKILSYCVGKYAPDAEFIPIKSTNEECVIKCRRTKYGQPTEWQYVKFGIDDAKRAGLLNKKGVHWIGDGIQNMLNKDCYAKAMRLIARAECRGGHINEELPSVPLTDPDVDENESETDMDETTNEDPPKKFIPTSNIVTPAPIIDFIKDFQDEKVKIEKIEIQKPVTVESTIKTEIIPQAETKIIKQSLFDFDFGEPTQTKPAAEPIKKEDNILPNIKDLKNEGLILTPEIIKNGLEIPKTTESNILKLMDEQIKKNPESISIITVESKKPESVIQQLKNRIENELPKPEPTVEFTENGVVFKDVPKLETVKEFVDKEIVKEEYSEYCLTDTCELCGVQKDNICGATNHCEQCDTLAVIEKEVEQAPTIAEVTEKKTRKKKSSSKKEVVEINQSKPFPIKEMSKLEADIDTKEVYTKIGEDWFASISIEDFNKNEITDYNILAYKDTIKSLYAADELVLSRISQRVVEWCMNTSNTNNKMALMWREAIAQEGLDMIKVDNWYMRLMLKAIFGIEQLAAIMKGMGTLMKPEEYIQFIINASGDKKWDIKQANWALNYMKSRGLI